MINYAKIVYKIKYLCQFKSKEGVYPKGGLAPEAAFLVVCDPSMNEL